VKEVCQWCDLALRKEYITEGIFSSYRMEMTGAKAILSNFKTEIRFIRYCPRCNGYTTECRLPDRKFWQKREAKHTDGVEPPLELA
jgi:hypothetical protein